MSYQCSLHLCPIELFFFFLRGKWYCEAIFSSDMEDGMPYIAICKMVALNATTLPH